MALRIDEGNLQILRDLSFLQVQVRDITDFIETRRQILQSRPGSRMNWICFAIANHMAKKYDMVGIQRNKTTVPFSTHRRRPHPSRRGALPPFYTYK